MFKKLCVVLVAVAVLVTVAVFAWPESVPMLALPAPSAPQAALAPQPKPATPPAKRLAVQPQPARQQVARPAAVASPAPQQQPAQDPEQLKAQREAKWRAYKAVRAEGRLQRLQQALGAAKREGRASDVAALEKQLGREQARLKLLTARGTQP